MSSQGKAQRRTLKECFRTLLHRRQDDLGHLTQGSCTLYEKGPALTLLPSLTSLSTLSDFGSHEFDISQSSLSFNQNPKRAWSGNHAPNGSQVTVRPRIRSTSTLTSSDVQELYLLESDIGDLARACGLRDNQRPVISRSAMSSDLVKLGSVPSVRSFATSISLSQTITSDTIHFQSPLSRLAHTYDIPPVYQQGVSLQASLATISSLSRSTSTLRLRRSSRSLRSNNGPKSLAAIPDIPSIASCPAVNSEVIVRQTNLRKPAGRTLLLENPIKGRTLTPSPRPGAEARRGGGGINHFESFCVLDAATAGCPITAISDDLREVFELGEPFVLNAADIDGTGMDTITGRDAQGNMVVHFIIYNPLVNPNNGRSRFVLASLLDITSFITASADVPDLEAPSEESVVDDDEEIRTPPGIRFRTHSSFNLSREYFIASESILDDAYKTPIQPLKDDIWLDLASEETRYSRSVKSSSGSTSRSRSTRSSKSSVNDVLDQFLITLQGMYSDFFLLGMSPLDDSSFDIWNVSPSLNQNRDYIDGYLAHISGTEKAYLDQKLTQRTSFVMRIKWGAAGVMKQLHCIPLFGRSNVTWICFLVEEGKWAELPTWQ